MLFNFTLMPDWNNINILHKNRLAPRSFFLLYPSQEDFYGNLTLDKSKLITSLNGEWHFRYFSSAMEIPLDFEDCMFDQKTIDVPSVWQTRGIEPPFYLNVPYQFPYNPPYIPMNNPAAIYTRNFKY